MNVRAFVATLVAASLSVITVAGTITSAGATAPQAKAPTWKVGDCYAGADVDADEVNLATKVACSKKHAVQIVAGEKLPAPLAASELADLLAPTSSEREEIVKLAREVCAPTAVAETIYPKQAKALAPLFEEHSIDEFVPPLSGRTGWVLPDEKSYDAGAKALLCIFEPDGSAMGTTAGSVLDLAKGAPLETLRLCFDFNAANDGTEFQPCDEVHDMESMIWLPLSVEGLPADVAAWADADWASLDEVCAEFATVLIGAERTDLTYRVDTPGDVAAVDGTRVFNCQAYPAEMTAAFPAGFNLNGIGAKKIKFATT